jgi:carbonic anhydrase
MNLTKLSLIAALVFTTGFSAACAAGNATATGKPDPAAKLLRDASLMLLREGNTRFITGKPQHPHQDAERRLDVSKGQEPFATVLACSDSRDPVELIFDRGVGDLFVVRVAGNIAGLSELATVEYGVGHLNTPMLVVMGHTKCGAVTAVANGAELHGHLHVLADKIKPAVDKTKAGKPEPDELVPRCIQANVWQTIEDIIKQSSVVREKLAEGKLSIVGAIYDLEQGKVSWLGQHPAEDSLVALASQAATDASLAPKAEAHGPAPAKKTAAAPAAPVRPTSHGHDSADTDSESDEHAKPVAQDAAGQNASSGRTVRSVTQSR